MSSLRSLPPLPLFVSASIGFVAAYLLTRSASHSLTPQSSPSPSPSPSDSDCPTCHRPFPSPSASSPDSDSSVPASISPVSDPDPDPEPDIIAQLYSDQDTEAIKAALVDSLYAIFSTVDTDHDGLIDRAQFQAFLAKLGLDETRESALMSLVADGQNESGISYESFLKRFEGGLEAHSSQSINNRHEGLQNAEIAAADSFSADAEEFSQTNSSEHQPRALKPISVFLGGACGATSWRTRVAIPLLSQYNISYYNPQVREWHQHLVCLENLMKAWCKILLFVIGRSTRSLVSMIESAALIASGRKVVLVVRSIEADSVVEGSKISPSEAKDLNRARHYLMDIAHTYHTPIFDNVTDACNFIINEVRDERKRIFQADKRQKSTLGQRIEGAAAAGSLSRLASSHPRLSSRSSSISSNHSTSSNGPSAPLVHSASQQELSRDVSASAAHPLKVHPNQTEAASPTKLREPGSARNPANSPPPTGSAADSAHSGTGSSRSHRRSLSLSSVSIKRRMSGTATTSLTQLPASTTQESHNEPEDSSEVSKSK